MLKWRYFSFCLILIYSPEHLTMPWISLPLNDLRSPLSCISAFDHEGERAKIKQGQNFPVYSIIFQIGNWFGERQIIQSPHSIPTEFINRIIEEKLIKNWYIKTQNNPINEPPKQYCELCTKKTAYKFYTWVAHITGFPALLAFPIIIFWARKTFSGEIWMPRLPRAR